MVTQHQLIKCVRVACLLATLLNFSLLTFAQPVRRDLPDCLAGSFRGMVVENALSGEVLIEENGNKYFTPASLTKLVTTYTALTFLQDTLDRFLYKRIGDTLCIFPLGDPSWFHQKFEAHTSWLDTLCHPRLDVQLVKLILPSMPIYPYAEGVSWEDINAYYGAPYSQLCIAGNQAEISRKTGTNGKIFSFSPRFFKHTLQALSSYKIGTAKNPYRRALFSNKLYYNPSAFTKKEFNPKIPIYTSREDLRKLLAEKVGMRVMLDTSVPNVSNWKRYRAQAKDTVLKLMLYESDNFIANQLLLQSSYVLTTGFDVDAVIEHVKKKDFIDAPHRMRWIDASGLSRYNQQTPKNILYFLRKLLKKIKTIEQMTQLLPTFGEGTLDVINNTELRGRVFAKTGSMNGIFGIAGILHTQKRTPLLFTILYNGGLFKRKEALHCAHSQLLEIYYQY